MFMYLNPFVCSLSFVPYLSFLIFRSLFKDRLTILQIPDLCTDIAISR